MSQCISVGTRNGDTFPIDRIMEAVWIDPDRRRCVINADICLHNDTDREQHLCVIHRGSLFGEDATREAWGDDPAPDSWPRSVAERLTTLHFGFDPIERHAPGVIRIAGRDYLVWVGPAGQLTPVVEQLPDCNCPFTMWEIGPFAPGKRFLIRLQLTLSSKSYHKQVDSESKFKAYGDAILLDYIRNQDLPDYSESDSDRYHAALESFRSHIVPGIFEWLLVSPEHESRRWETTPLSHNLSRRVIRDRYRDTTHWFVADYDLAREFELKGNPSNAFVLDVEAAPAGASSSRGI